MITLLRRIRPVLAGAVAVALLAALPAGAADAPLPSWNPGRSRDAIIEFVTRVTREGGWEYVKPVDRLAVFDDNGTLWPEMPLPAELVFSIERVKELSLVHPEWKTQEPFASILKGDVDAALSGGENAITAITAATHAGMNTDTFAKQVTDWLATARNPAKNRLYTDLTYQPMQELLAYLRANQFTIYISSGGSSQFARASDPAMFGVLPENIIGSNDKMQFQFLDGDPVIQRLPEVAFLNNGPGKPVGIETHIGRRPIMAFGNSDDDMQLMQYVCVEPGPTFCGFIHHTDDVRSFAYDRTSPIGRFDLALDAAEANGWILVDMAKDWREVFSPAQ